jgi:hypothetical protein
MKKSALFFVIAFCTGFSQLANSNNHIESKSMDVTKCEGMTNSNFSISSLDVNKDGVISKSEYLDGNKSNNEKTFKHIDANGDGKLDQAEQAEIEVVYKAIHQNIQSKNISI